ncbi:MAG: DUF4919 domain-containing protein [Blastocatellia bacterium]|nr:DUF4919 domain-containing protein [Blastocatellia bacterium]
MPSTFRRRGICAINLKGKGKKDMFINYLSLLPAGLALILASSFPRNNSVQQVNPTYESLLEQVKKSDPAANFTALRIAYADAPSKEGSDVIPFSDASRSMYSAMQDKKYEKAIEYAEKVLKAKFVDINAHMIASAAYKEKGDTEKEQFHRYVATGLIKSILSSGDGKTQETAFKVISTDEEYVILRVYGLMPQSQSLLNAKGHSYDRLDAVDPKTKEKVSLYFNIDIPFGALKKIIEK